MRIAVLDLGTNTFNLLIAEKTNNGDDSLNFLFKDRRPVFLGRSGISKNLIPPEALTRAWDVLNEFRNISDEYKVAHILAYGTSAFRTANNGRNFIDEVRHKLNIEINVISGELEAMLIYLGIRQSIPPTDEPFLIIDIGGGSNELIVGNTKEIFWKKSFPIGMARLQEKFSLSDPISTIEIERLNNFFEFCLAEFFHMVLPQFPINKVIGAEGAFESFIHLAESMLCDFPKNKSQLHAVDLPIDCFKRVLEKLIPSTLDERLKMPGLEPFRASMIVTAGIFVNFVLQRLQWPKLIVSEYSLKEGAAWNFFFTKRKRRS
ncbi:MAG: hypothetical protein N2662_04445 [Bacteroidales bacterium]|nr:hypothetical protein [Bacteroidales bacterium]